MKYRYEKVMQGNYGYGWDDLTAYDCDSTGFIKDKAQREEYKSDRKAYNDNEPQPHRAITRRIKLEESTCPKCSEPLKGEHPYGHNKCSCGWFGHETQMISK